ncbi:hypothetical protein AAG906_037559 [Vitis piasezkii]
MVGASSSWSRALVRISPSTFSVISIAIGIGVSALDPLRNDGFDLFFWSFSLLGCSVLSVIFCEVVAIYGVIVAIILQTKLESVPASNIYAPESLRVGYAIFASGIIMGFANLVCGSSVRMIFLYVATGRSFSISSYTQYFNVDIDVVLNRLISSLHPIGGDFFSKIDANPHFSNPCLTSSDGSSTPTPLVSSFDFVNSDLSFGVSHAMHIWMLKRFCNSTLFMKRMYIEIWPGPPFSTTDNQAKASTCAIKFQHSTLDL